MLVWAVILFFCGLALLILEAFIPSHGLLGVLSIGALTAAIVFGYLGNWVEGTIILAATVIGVPVAVVLMLKYWPETPIGRRVLLGVPASEEVLPDVAERRALIGKRGIAQSVMLPSGPVEIDGDVIDAVSEGMVIESGQRVEVVESGALRVVVRLVEDDEEETPASKQTGHDPLAQPVDDIGLGPITANAADQNPDTENPASTAPATQQQTNPAQQQASTTHRAETPVQAANPAQSDAEQDDDSTAADDVFSQEILLDDDELEDDDEDSEEEDSERAHAPRSLPRRRR
jgi:hypothetical protein